MIIKINKQKAIEATGILLRLTKYRKMDRKRLLALLFFAERETLLKTGRTMIGGRISALPFGPIHSEVYDLIKGGGHGQSDWSRHFENEDYRVLLADYDLGTSSLSRFEIDILNEVSERFAGRGTWDVAMASHTEEYEKNYKLNTSTTIPVEDMIEAVNRSSDSSSILDDMADSAAFDAFFGSNP